MLFFEMVVKSLLAGAVGGALAVLYTLPLRYIVPSFLCAFSGWFIRDACMRLGMGYNWGTAVASAVVVLVAVAVTRREAVSPAILITGVLPLGAALAVFNTIIGLVKVSTMTGEALTSEAILLCANVGKVVTTSLAIALGLAAGLMAVRVRRRKPSQRVMQP